MNTIIFVFGVICIPIAGILSAILCTYISQVKNLKNKIDFIYENDTNLTLSSKLYNKSIYSLINSINKIIINNRKNNIQLQNLNLNYKESITSISHDIRTPLTSLSGYIQMLSKEDIPYHKKLEYIEIMENRMDSVKTMLDQLFEFSRIESGELTLQSNLISINNILRDSVSLFYDKLMESSLTPLITIPDYAYNILGDKDALHRVFINIINNAIVHGDRDIVITSKKSHNKYQVIFENTTYTIIESDIENIFERFYTSDKSRTKKTTGLGLAISKRLVNKMNGNIYANLSNNKFSIVIEFHKSPKSSLNI